MKITVKRTGGFAGLSEEIAAANTERMNPAAAQKVEQLVQGIGFFTLAAHVSGGEVGADLFHYEITVIEGDHQHTVAFDDDGSPEIMPLRRFVDALAKIE